MVCLVKNVGLRDAKELGVEGEEEKKVSDTARVYRMPLHDEKGGRRA